MLSFASQVGNLFNRIGRIGSLVKNARSNQNTQLTALTDTTTGVVAQYNGESDLQALIGSSYIGQLNSIGSIGLLASNVAQQTLNRMIYRDLQQVNQTLQQLNLNQSMSELIRQMKITGASVLAMSITAVPGLFTTAITNVGNGIITTSVRRPIDGFVQENTFAETLTLKCITDSYSGSATAGNETIQIVGCGAAGVFDFNWPLGSNANTTLSAINGNASNSQGNGLVNSGFETFVGNTPNNFIIEVGTAGVQVFKEVNLNYDGISSLRIQGDGTNLTTLSQTFNSSSGTSAQLAQLSQYSVNLFLRRDGVAAGQGTLVVELTDGTGQVIKDANGANNSFSIDLTQLTTVYTAYNGIFRTPTILPTAQKIRLRLSTALTNGRSIYIDKMSMGLTTLLYLNGPYIAVHAGSVPFAISDYAYITTTNSRGAAGTLSTFQTLFVQLFPNMLSNGFLLPSSSTPTISDSALIV